MKPRHLTLCIVVACLIAWIIWNIASEPSLDAVMTHVGANGRSRIAGVPTGPRDEVARAGKRLLAKKNVQTELDIRIGDRPATHMRIEYASPDRYRAWMGRSESIVIGDDRYEKVDDYWAMVPISTAPSGYLYSAVFSPRKWKEAKDVRSLGTETLDGHAAVIYTYQILQGRTNCSEKLWIGKETGLPARAETTCPGPMSMETTQVFTYNSTITVEPPPAA